MTTEILLKENASDSKILNKIVFIGQRKQLKSTKEENLTVFQLEIIKYLNMIILFQKVYRAI